MPPRRKRHHTVTRALLEGFAYGGQVLVRSRDGKEFNLATGSATVANDFYSFLHEGEHDDAVEDWLSKDVEHAFASLLPNLRAGVQPPKQEHRVIARFLATALLRTKTARSYMRQIDDHVAGRVLLQMAAPRLGLDLRSMSHSEIEELVQFCDEVWAELPYKPDTVLTDLRVMVHQSNRIEGVLNSYVWSVLQGPGPYFLIGDTPAVVVDGHQTGWRGVLPEGATIFLPISPSKVLIGEPHSFGRPFAGDELVATVNALTVRDAFRDVLRHPETAWPAELHLGPAPPSLPIPTRTYLRSPLSGQPTFPYTYPGVNDAKVAALLEKLRMNHIVE